MDNAVVGLLGGLLSLGGLNTPVAPTNPLGALVWQVFRDFESCRPGPDGRPPHGGHARPDNRRGERDGQLHRARRAAAGLYRHGQPRQWHGHHRKLRALHLHPDADGASRPGRSGRPHERGPGHVHHHRQRRFGRYFRRGGRTRTQCLWSAADHTATGNGHHTATGRVTTPPPGTVTTPPPGTVTTFTAGETAIQPTDDHGNGNMVCGQQIQLTPTSSTVVSLSFYVTNPAGQLYLGIYDTDANGEPQNLKASTAVFTPTTGWNTQPVAGSVTLPAGKYWIAYHASSDNLGFRFGAGESVVLQRRVRALPGTFAAGANQYGDHWSLYGTFATVGAVPPPVSTPVVTSISPNPGKGGPVTISGSGFLPGSTVTFGADPALNTVVVNSTTITCDAPAHADGAVDVVVTTSAATGKPYTFTYQAVTPTGTSPIPVGPNSGVTSFDFAPLVTNALWDDLTDRSTGNQSRLLATGHHQPGWHPVLHPRQRVLGRPRPPGAAGVGGPRRRL